MRRRRAIATQVRSVFCPCAARARACRPMTARTAADLSEPLFRRVFWSIRPPRCSPISSCIRSIRKVKRRAAPPPALPSLAAVAEASCPRDPRQADLPEHGRRFDRCASLNLNCTTAKHSFSIVAAVFCLMRAGSCSFWPSVREACSAESVRAKDATKKTKATELCETNLLTWSDEQLNSSTLLRGGRFVHCQKYQSRLDFVLA